MDGPDVSIDELWADVLARWDDDAAHAAFLEACRAVQRLDFAAHQYRAQMRSQDPYRADDARARSAEKRLGAVAIVAMATLDVGRTDREEARFALQRSTTMRRIVMLAFVGLALAAAAMRYR